MEVSVFQFLLISILYGVCSGGLFFIITDPLRYPMVLGAVIGIILGDPLGGATVAAYIALIYLGIISVGGTAPADKTVATVIGTTFALSSGLDYEAALAIAVPLGIAAANLRTWVRTFCTIFGTGIVNSVHAHQIGRMKLWAVANGLFKGLFYGTIMFVALTLGIETMANVLLGLPEWAMNGLNVAGNALPAVGLALGLSYIGDRGKILLAVIAFTVSKVLGLSTMACVLITTCLLIIQVYKKMETGELDFGGSLKDAGEKKHILSMKDTIFGILRILNLMEWGFGIARRMGNAVILGLYPIMKKLYPGDVDRQCEELGKHDAFFNTNLPFMGLITGPVIMMEEERAQGNESITPESIQAFKAGMQGPVAALGDPMQQGVYNVIVQSISISIVLGGSFAGVYLQFFSMVAFKAIMVTLLGYWSYKYGSTLVEKLYSSGATKVITEFAGMVGCVAFGALGALVVKVSTGDLTVAGVNIQTALFDKILPGILPLATILLCYGLLKSGKLRIVPLLLVMFFGCFALGAIGVLG